MRITTTRSIMTRLQRSRVVSTWCPTTYCCRRHNHHQPKPPQQQQDETLLWASQHRALAQACLELPPTSPTESTCPMPLQSLEDYLTWRQWEIPPSVDHHAKALLSHVLSAPLTAATQLFPTFCDDQGSHRRKKTKPMNWCCIGARSEASLPVEYWREILVLWAHQQQQPQSPSSPNVRTVPLLQATIDFVGPDILRRPPVHLSYQGHSLTLRWLYNGTFHEYLHRTSQDPLALADDMVPASENSWDAYLLFNPGLGHDNLQKQWEPTLKLLLSAYSTVGSQTGHTARIVFTAHSAEDATRDTNLLTNYLLPEAPLYQENPFASRILYQDPLQENHMVRPNHYAYTLVWQ